MQPHIQNNTNFFIAVSYGDGILIRLAAALQGMHVKCSNTYRGFKIRLQICALNVDYQVTNSPATCHSGPPKVKVNGVFGEQYVHVLLLIL